MIANFTISPMVREALAVLVIQNLLAARTSEETKADQTVCEGLAVL